MDWCPHVTCFPSLVAVGPASASRSFSCVWPLTRNQHSVWCAKCVGIKNGVDKVSYCECFNLVGINWKIGNADSTVKLVLGETEKKGRKGMMWAVNASQISKQGRDDFAAMRDHDVDDIMERYVLVCWACSRTKYLLNRKTTNWSRWWATKEFLPI